MDPRATLTIGGDRFARGLALPEWIPINHPGDRENENSIGSCLEVYPY